MKASTMSKVINWLRTDPGGTCTPLDVLPVRRRMFDVFSRDDLLTWWLIDSGLTPAQPSDVELEESADVNEIERFRSQRLAPLGLCA